MARKNFELWKKKSYTSRETKRFLVSPWTVFVVRTNRKTLFHSKLSRSTRTMTIISRCCSFLKTDITVTLFGWFSYFDVTIMPCRAVKQNTMMLLDICATITYEKKLSTCFTNLRKKIYRKINVLNLPRILLFKYTFLRVYYTNKLESKIPNIKFPCCSNIARLHTTRWDTLKILPCLWIEP